MYKYATCLSAKGIYSNVLPPHKSNISNRCQKWNKGVNFWKMHMVVNDDYFFLTDTVYLHLKEVKQKAVDCAGSTYECLLCACVRGMCASMDRFGLSF